MSDDVKEIEQNGEHHSFDPNQNANSDTIKYGQEPEPIEKIDKDEKRSEEEVKNIRDTWIWLFRQHSHMNDDYGRFALHVFLGQMLRNLKIPIDRNEIDGRINFFLVQDSSSGKSAAFGLFDDLGERLNISVNDRSDFSTAAAVGSFDYEERKRLIREMKNDKDDAPDSTEEATERSKEIGFLDGSGIVTCEEGKQFISNTDDYSQGKVENLQKAMNPIEEEGSGNVLTRDLKHGQIKAESEKSFLIVTYPPPNLQEKILTTGLFQRMLLYVNLIDYQGWKDRYEYRAQNIDSQPDGDLYEERLESVVEELKDIQEKYQNQTRIPWSGPDTGPDDDNAKERAAEIHRTMMEETVDVKEYVARHLRSYISRYINHAYMMAVHYCALRRGDMVLEEDVEKAHERIDVVFNSLAKYLSESTDSEEMKNKKDMVWDLIVDKYPDWLNAAGDNGFLKKQTWVRYVKNSDLDVSKASLNDYLKEWEDMGRADWEKAKGREPARVKFYIDK